MLQIIISPAKTLNFDKNISFKNFSTPVFLKKSNILVEIMKKYSASELSDLMKISPKLADLNFERFLLWKINHTIENSKQAVNAYNGDVYDGLNTKTFSESDFDFAQNHLRILSGLYGVLKPLDLIMPYRLEMGTAIAGKHGKNLYDFWGNCITEELNAGMKNNAVLVNLASNEYFKAINSKILNTKILTPIFKEDKEGNFQIVSFFAKKARGLMSRFIIQNRIEKTEDLKAFNLAGYAFNSRLSTANEFVFTR